MQCFLIRLGSLGVHVRMEVQDGNSGLALILLTIKLCNLKDSQ